MNQHDGSDSVLYAKNAGVSTTGGLIGDAATYTPLTAQEHIDNFFNRDAFVALVADERIYYTGEHEGLPICLSGRVVI